MFNKKSFLFSFAFTAIYFAIQDYRVCQKRLNQYKQVQKEIKGFK